VLYKKIAKRITIAAAASGLALLTSVGTANADPNAPWIGDGYSNNTHAVWCVQHSINYYRNNTFFKYYNALDAIAPIAEDGAWGPQTRDAVKWFQQYNNEATDGIVGPSTGTELLWWGDPSYNGTSNSNVGYCYWYLPGAFNYLN
jgi:hypothetical protein